MKILVTGGAGYVGSHTARLLDRAGHDVWIYDNLTTGHRRAAIPERLIEGELADRPHLTAVLREKQIDAVFHFAAKALVGESVEHPERYYENNVVGTLHFTPIGKGAIEPHQGSMRGDTQNAAAQLALEAVHHREHDDQCRHAQHQAEH